MNSVETVRYADDKRKEKSFTFSEVPLDKSALRISTDRYISPEFQERERENLWMKVWQFVGRVDEIPATGDWKEYRIFDQSFIVVRGKDAKIRGFANVCPHRGNTLCVGGKGNAKALHCPFHNWTFDLDGSLRGIARPDLVGPIDKEKLGLPEVPVDTFAGFIFLNPDPDAKPLAEFLGKDVMEWLAPYHLEDMIPVGINVRESLDCNWKVVVDAFQEGYHIQGLHPQMGEVIRIDPAKSRMNFIGDHHLSVAPFEVTDVEGFSPEREIEGIRTRLPATYHGAAEVMPFFDALVEECRSKDGKIEFPKGVTGHTLLQRATREVMTRKGLDVSGLSDEQMTDHFGWLIFPNFFFSVRAGEGTLIVPTPHPEGDPNKCVWHVIRYAWLPPQVREENRADLVEVKEPGTYPYFLVLQQDYESMPRQQKGLRNRRLTHLTVGQEESLLAKFHQEVDKYVEGRA